MSPLVEQDGKQDMSWKQHGLCAQTDPDAFYPEKGSLGGTSRPAKQVCATCPVRDECLDYAVATEERWGIWGGLTERERRQLKRRTQPGTAA